MGMVRTTEKGACMRRKLNTLVFQAHEVQGERQIGECRREILKIKNLYFFWLRIMGIHGRF